MRARLTLIVLALVLVGGFAALNWAEFTRTTPLNFGAFITDASVGGVMLVAFGVVLLVMLLSSALHESRYVLESHRHAKALEAQRVLAEKAEASRFTDLRQHLDLHLRENRQREAIAATEYEKAMAQGQRELRTQLEQMGRALESRLAEMEARMDARLGARLSPLPPVPDEVASRERVKL